MECFGDYVCQDNLSNFIIFICLVTYYVINKYIDIDMIKNAQQRVVLRNNDIMAEIFSCCCLCKDNATINLIAQRIGEFSDGEHLSRREISQNAYQTRPEQQTGLSIV